MQVKAQKACCLVDNCPSVSKGMDAIIIKKKKTEKKRNKTSVSMFHINLIFSWTVLVQ